MTQASEWATDVMFRSPAALAAIYPQLARHGKGRDILTAIIATQELTMQELRKAAA